MKAEDLRKITQDRSVELLESNKRWIIEQLKIKASAGYTQAEFDLEASFEHNDFLQLGIIDYFQKLDYSVGFRNNLLYLSWKL